MRISDWSSDVCSSDLLHAPDITVEQIVEAGRDAGQRIFESLIGHARFAHDQIPAVIGPEAHDLGGRRTNAERTVITAIDDAGRDVQCALEFARSEEHTSELQSLMRISYAVFCLQKKKQQRNTIT